MTALRNSGYLEAFVNSLARRGQPTGRGESTVNELGTDDSTFWAAVPYVKGFSKLIANALGLLSIRVAHCMDKIKWHVCRNIKDKVPSSQRTGVVYKIPCAKCDAMYVGETMRSLDVKMWENRQITEAASPSVPLSQGMHKTLAHCRVAGSGSC